MNAMHTIVDPCSCIVMHKVWNGGLKMSTVSVSVDVLCRVTAQYLCESDPVFPAFTSEGAFPHEPRAKFDKLGALANERTTNAGIPTGTINQRLLPLYCAFSWGHVRKHLEGPTRQHEPGGQRHDVSGKGFSFEVVLVPVSPRQVFVYSLSSPCARRIL